jgi:hypothetical protein
VVLMEEVDFELWDPALQLRVWISGKLEEKI